MRAPKRATLGNKNIEVNWYETCVKLVIADEKVNRDDEDEQVWFLRKA